MVAMFVAIVIGCLVGLGMSAMLTSAYVKHKSRKEGD